MPARRDLLSSDSRLPVRSSQQLKVSLRDSQQDEEPLRRSEQDAAELLAEAFREAKLTTKEVAHLCGCSTSLVEKWISRDQRGCPSFAQMLCLPATFHWQLHKAMNRRFGFGRMALRNLMEAAESLGMVIE